MTALVVCTSCLKDENDDTVYYSDMAITGFTLGSMNRYTHVTSSSTGKDSLVKTTVSGLSYKMTIDQLQAKIYNTKMLPVGTDVSRVVCTISTLNNGVVALQSMTSDSLRWHSATDSVDLSQPRVFRVFASDGSGYRDYTVSLNVSSDQGVSFGWDLVQTLEMPTGDVRLEASGDSVVMSHDSGVFTFGGTQYAIGLDDGLLKSRAVGTTEWVTEPLDEADSLLPARGGMAMVSWPYMPADNTNYILMVGQPRQDDVQTMRLWRKIAPIEGGGQWVFMPFDDLNHYPLKRMQQPLLAYYSGSVLCIDDEANVWQSRDQGISWRKSSTYKLPATFSGTPLSMAADSKGRLWLLTSEGQLWQGALK